MVEENMTQLVADGADVNFRFREMHGWTALHWAAAYGEAPPAVAMPASRD